MSCYIIDREHSYDICIYKYVYIMCNAPQNLTYNQYIDKATILLSSKKQVTSHGVTSKIQASIKQTKHNKEMTEMQTMTHAITQAATEAVSAAVKNRGGRPSRMQYQKKYSTCRPHRAHIPLVSKRQTHCI